MAARAAHAAVALLAIAFVAIAAWSASLVASRVFPAPSDDHFPPRDLEVRSKPSVLYPQNQAECVAHGGAWLLAMGMSDRPGCLMPNSDAGHVCSDSIDCEGLCTAPDGTREGARVSGHCVDRRPAFGCRSVVVHGRAWTICSD